MTRDILEEFEQQRGQPTYSIVVARVGAIPSDKDSDDGTATKADLYGKMAKKACTTDLDCAAPGDGPCVSRGPFGVPGRSLLASDVTVSSGSLTSSLITFFSPPKELFRATSSAGGGGVSQTVTNSGTSPLNITIPAYHEGCCPADEGVPHQLRCGDTCVDYLNDPNNCGACGTVCGEGTCCSGGVCAGLCGDGLTWCGEQCADEDDGVGQAAANRAE